ncbi:hypothetical protein [Pseudoalteromonas obscura]|uniref:CD-NTase-associated protein 12/Pycsar effector protein TIR domain-containing protein n=1 Tax=Pseudoalteromonas obscura TaxID=3048491 RepID=A0ABT7EEQ9_9GAMM|nr:hypothetical protein [Pseudoalteromonas sp. P94(2023)]MDK2593523.1 hypothetical protein [Pseudoalteromonas sp. P94(2023)]
MTEKVFYSWQSDSPGNTNRNLISSALEKAISELKNDESVEVQPVIDRDTLGIAGSPDISQSIFSKIDSASAFVCDVSIIDSDAKKPSPNPNVLIELGYAIKVLGWNRIIMIMNIEYGQPESLPFDLRSKRVLTYSVASDAQEKAPARNSLKKTLVVALKLILENHGLDNGENKIQEQVDNHVKPIDIKLFSKFKEVMPSKGSISFIDEQNMAGFSWPRDSIKELEKFYYEWNDADHEFLDKELEELRSKLHHLIGDYLGQIATNTFPARDHTRQTVPPEWEDENPNLFFEVVNKLHETAGSIVGIHQELVRKGRQKLGV